MTATSLLRKMIASISVRMRGVMLRDSGRAGGSDGAQSPGKEDAGSRVGDERELPRRSSGVLSREGGRSEPLAYEGRCIAVMLDGRVGGSGSSVVVIKR